METIKINQNKQDNHNIIDSKKSKEGNKENIYTDIFEVAIMD